MTQVQVRNWQGGSKEDLVNFVRRKTDVDMQSVRVSGPVLFGTIRKSDAQRIGRCDGLKFAGSILSVQVDQGPPGEQQQEGNNTVQALRQFLRSRYNPQAKMLDLTNMKGDPLLQQVGVFATPSTSAKMFPALMKIADNERDLAVESVNLASNSLQEVTSVTTLAQSFPNLKNLSLADNQIARLRGIESWRHKFRNLRELILTGNPIIANEPTYKEDVMKMFPRLVMLDGNMVRDESQLDVLKLPLPVKHAFFENPDVQNVASNFLTSYFDLFDRDRAQLLQLYDDMSMFSLSVNNQAPRIITTNAMGPHSWSAYIPMSRNMARISANQRQTKLSLGPQAIGNAFRRIPETKHALVESPEKFAIDVWRTQGVRQPDDTAIVVAVHGEFMERDHAQRSFDRTFILLPAQMGSMVVASDMFTVRAWSGYDAYKESDQQPQPQPQPQPPAGEPNNIPPELAGLKEDQLMVIQNIMNQTRLTPQYARMCAEQASFDLQQALALFQQSQQQLPPDAFAN
jgi:nuclear RNA export factor